LLQGCLAALAAQDHANYEIVVVDNAAISNRARAIAARHGARYALEPRAGLDLARNRGVAVARGAIVAFTDDDARPDTGWLTAITSRFAEVPDAAAVTGQVVAAELSTRAQLLFEHAYSGMDKGDSRRAHRRGRVPTYLPGAFGTGCNMAFRREVLARVGAFDNALDAGTLAGGGGDLDILQRLFETSHRIEYEPAARVRHIHRRTTRELRSQLFDNGRGYSAAMTAAFLRASAPGRVLVVGWWLAWGVWWLGRRVVLRIARRHALPLSFMLAELAGALVGPTLYAVARRRARASALPEAV
jgi:GT2 family glycosyltransferase